MTTGSALARSLAEKRAEVESSLRSVAGKIDGLGRETSLVVAEEGKLWSAFAAIQIGEPIGLPSQIEAMLEKRSRKIEEAKAAIKSSEDKIESLAKARETAAASALALARVLEGEQAAVKAKLDANPDVVGLRVSLARLDEVEASLLDKGKRATQERDEKRVAYDRDEHFVYLLKRGFGTPAYSGWGIVRHLDGWLANLISFRKKAGDFKRLNDIPAWIQERLDKVGADRQAKASELKKTTDAEFLATKASRDAAASSKSALEAIEKEIATEREAVHHASKIISDSALATDEDMKRITAAFADMLSRKGIDSLAAAAAQTATVEDDLIVEKLRKLSQRRETLASQAAALKPGLVEFERRVDAIREVEGKLRSRGWTGSDHRFSSRLPSSTADDLAQGTVTAAAIWSLMQSAHSHDEPYSGYSRSSSGSSYGSGSGGGSTDGSSWGSSGGGFGGSDWSSGGGFGGGDSSTGGGF